MMYVYAIQSAKSMEYVSARQPHATVYFVTSEAGNN